MYVRVGVVYYKLCTCVQDYTLHFINLFTVFNLIYNLLHWWHYNIFTKKWRAYPGVGSSRIQLFESITIEELSLESLSLSPTFCLSYRCEHRHLNMYTLSLTPTTCAHTHKYTHTSWNIQVHRYSCPHLLVHTETHLQVHEVFTSTQKAHLNEHTNNILTTCTKTHLHEHIYVLIHTADHIKITYTHTNSHTHEHITYIAALRM